MTKKEIINVLYQKINNEYMFRIFSDSPNYDDFNTDGIGFALIIVYVSSYIVEKGSQNISKDDIKRKVINLHKTNVVDNKTLKTDDSKRKINELASAISECYVSYIKE